MFNSREKEKEKIPKTMGQETMVCTCINYLLTWCTQLMTKVTGIFSCKFEDDHLRRNVSVVSGPSDQPM